ncbi:hypothetical protein QOT17_009550 [Balamuthia mandrillaris]
MRGGRLVCPAASSGVLVGEEGFALARRKAPFPSAFASSRSWFGRSLPSLRPYSSSSLLLIHPPRTPSQSHTRSSLHGDSNNASFAFNRRDYAKAKGKGGGGGKGGHRDSAEEGEESVFSADEFMDQTEKDLKNLYERTVDFLKEEFSKLRIGKANPDILKRVKVEGAALTKKAEIHARDALTLVVTPLDPSQVSKIAKAILETEPQLNPQPDSDTIVIKLPRGSKEARDNLAKQASKLAEEAKASIRRNRQNTLIDVKKKKDALTKDDMKTLEKKIQTLTDEFNSKVESLLKTKEADIEKQ